MPTFEQPVVGNQIIVIVTLSAGPGEPAYNFRALLDTGATATAISPTAVRQLGLVPIGDTEVTVANGQTETAFTYFARVDIPIQYPQSVPPGTSGSFLWGKELVVVGLAYQPDGYDVILGMDIIGIFHVTIYNNRIILSN